MFSARHIYAAIGQEIRNNEYDSITLRLRRRGQKR